MGQTVLRLDAIAGIAADSAAVRVLERISFVCLVLMAMAAPHSIAATQTLWLIGLLAWVVRLAIGPRQVFRFGKLDAALLLFIGWSVLSAFLSYEPSISLDKLRGVGLFIILYYAYYNIRSMRAVRFVAIALIASSMASVTWAPLERLIGRGVELQGVKAEGALGKAGLAAGDTILTVNKHTVSSPEEAVTAIRDAGKAEIEYHRPDTNRSTTVESSTLGGGTALEELGISGWKTNRKWRAAGFYGHFTTYSEVLQLIGSLVLGLLLAAFADWLHHKRDKAANTATAMFVRRRLRVSAVVLGVCFGLIVVALLLSATRASQLGLAVSGLVMVMAAGSRKLAIAVLLLAIPAGVGGYYVLQQTRQQSETNEYRKTMWRDGARLATESPRHMLVGVGMDSLKKHWQEWGLFDRGYLPMGHFHSTPLQLAVERGMPALLFWLAFLAIYARTLWRAAGAAADTSARGILLGCLGGLAGFFTAGLVHYNLGDGEVAMVFYLLAGLSLRTADVALADQ